MLVAVVKHIAYFEGEYSSLHWMFSSFTTCVICVASSLRILQQFSAEYISVLAWCHVFRCFVCRKCVFKHLLQWTLLLFFSLFHTSHGLKACSLVESGQWEPVKHERSCKQVLLENGADRVGCDSGLWAGYLLKGKLVVCFSAPLFCWFPFMIGKELAVLYGTG